MCVYHCLSACCCLRSPCPRAPSELPKAIVQGSCLKRVERQARGRHIFRGSLLVRLRCRSLAQAADKVGAPWGCGPANLASDRGRDCGLDRCSSASVPAPRQKRVRLRAPSGAPRIVGFFKAVAARPLGGAARVGGRLVDRWCAEGFGGSSAAGLR